MTHFTDERNEAQRGNLTTPPQRSLSVILGGGERVS